MKYILIFYTFLFTLVLVAGDSEVVYTDVPTAEERQEIPHYFAFPGFEEIGVVIEGQPQPYWSELVNTQNWPAGYGKGIELSDFETIRVSDFDVIPENIIFEKRRAVIPFSLSVRYQLKGLPGIVEQGTIDSDGIIEILVSENEEFRVKMIRFDDSHEGEKIGRQLGSISQYDGDFVSMVSGPVITGFFLQKENQHRLVELIETSLNRY